MTLRPAASGVAASRLVKPVGKGTKDMQATMPAELTGFLEQHLTAEMLRYQTGQQMFCPACERCLDWQSTVSIDVLGKASGKLLSTMVLCATCADKLLPGFPERLSKAKERAGEDVQIKTVDGRDFDEDGEYSPAPEMRLGCVATFKAARKDNPAGELVSGFRVESLPDWGVFNVYQKDGKRFWVCEHQTGFAVASGETQKEAVINAFRKLRSVGHDKFTEAVAAVPVLNPVAAV